MASSKEYLEFILGQLSELEEITYRAMMGEFIIYYRGMIVGDSGIDRKNIFLSTKIWASEYENENTVEETLERLGVDYVDLLYIHQPAGNWLTFLCKCDQFTERFGVPELTGMFVEEC